MCDKNTINPVLVDELCPVCCKSCSSSIVMNTILDEEHYNEMENLKDKIFMGFHLCEECKKINKYYLIGINVEETDNVKDPQRTGNIYVIDKDNPKLDEILKDFPEEARKFMEEYNWTYIVEND